ncbi:glycosyltransferase family 2 protein [Luteolibacter ambystomatis]|uniref:Glycosyltransferase family 2 protein n=1 Tax=Luteolibacter ambystomatis TaxID=2824561 RepID=A0A975G9H1_9BACT|nr:glycosyltransferase family 2 protein [Luteolibacter ambystomatis]QUE51185.1 glycosyltransferase family 2 protein [Luteolibacter ambystomatis]
MNPTLAPPAPAPHAQRVSNVQPSISCVVPAFNEAAGIAAFLTELCAHLATLSSRHEVIVVDDGSRDSTVLEVIAASGGLPVKLVALSRNFGKEAAISAGLDEAHGEVVVILDADFQHPFSTIGEFIRHWQQGYDMVYGVRADRRTDPMVRRFLSRSFYAIISRGASVEIPADAGDFRLMDQKVVAAIRDLPENSRFMKGLYNWVGFRSIGIPFEVAERAEGHSRFNFRRLFELAITGLTSFSSFPLRLWVGVGSLVSGISIFYALFIVTRTLISGADVPGWATLVVAVTFLGGVQLFSIGILGEYVARIFNEVKHRPNYLVAERHGFSRDDHRS